MITVVYFIIGIFWFCFTSITFAHLHVKGFSIWDAGVYAWGIFFIAHTFYELPYSFYYEYFTTTHHVSPINIYLSVTGLIFLFWLSRNYRKSVDRFFRMSLPFELFLSSTVVMFTALSGTNILSGNYGMAWECWISRLLAVVYTSRITYDLEVKAI
jgi:hypothetical protein